MKLLLDVYYYENLTTPNGGAPLKWIIWVVYAGLLAGSVIATIDRRCCARFLKALRQRGAITAESAVSLAELDVGGRWYLRRALRPGKPLRKALCAVVEETEPLAGLSFRLAKLRGAEPVREIAPRFYLPEEKRYAAEARYPEESLRTLILAAILLTAVAVLAQTVIPELLTMLDNLIGTL